MRKDKVIWIDNLLTKFLIEKLENDIKIFSEFWFLSWKCFFCLSSKYSKFEKWDTDFFFLNVELDILDRKQNLCNKNYNFSNCYSFVDMKTIYRSAMLAAFEDAKRMVNAIMSLIFSSNPRNEYLVDENWRLKYVNINN